MQVGVTVLGNHLTQVRTLQHPSGDGQTNRINSYAIPQLEQEAMKAGNAHLDTVSGATFTSQGYRQSLQSALDAAHGAR
ncbi:FMN-binding protein [Kribbella solani]|uniref:FMN-binding protein n=1 Tax=Kribbella solani TaxID=236067 RepID=UPI0029A44B18|nr:FMN-binding protein [Kribbella solani]MDX2969218.1 FMN-binding protein [Kribbella solani]MDX3006331.1 FMN-binding protein [Kribbella solani]